MSISLHGEIVYAGYTREELEKAFDSLQHYTVESFLVYQETGDFDDLVPSDHWKDPVAGMVDADMFDELNAAFEFFTATSLVIVEDLGAALDVEGDGYRLGPAGDY